MSARYAIYYVPETGSALDVLGHGLLGRTALGEDAPRLRLNLPESLRLEEITKAPRHYGLHATLKAPFELAPGCTEEQLRDAVQALARQCHPFLLPPLDVGTVPDGAGGQGVFLALRPTELCEALQTLADRCVRDLDAFRAPLAAEDRARRKNLTSRQQENLCHFGYPHVLKDYFFHITLTDPLDDHAIRERVAISLRDVCATVCAPHRLELGGLALVSQPDRESPFRLLATFPFSSLVQGLFMHTPPTRQERMSALALARVESLADAVAQLPPLPPHTMPRPPEAGMVMARARTGNTGQAFHLGEVLVTRCTVYLHVPPPASADGAASPDHSDTGTGIMGHAWVRGRASRHAELAALLDALWQHPDYAPMLDQYLWSRLTRERQERIHAAAAAVAPTRVDFFTLVRGENEA